MKHSIRLENHESGRNIQEYPGTAVLVNKIQYSVFILISDSTSIPPITFRFSQLQYCTTTSQSIALDSVVHTEFCKIWDNLSRLSGGPSKQPHPTRLFFKHPNPMFHLQCIWHAHRSIPLDSTTAYKHSLEIYTTEHHSRLSEILNQQMLSPWLVSWSDDERFTWYCANGTEGVKLGRSHYCIDYVTG